MNDPLTLEFIRRIKPNFKVTKKADKESLRELILTNRKMRLDVSLGVFRKIIPSFDLLDPSAPTDKELQEKFEKRLIVEQVAHPFSFYKNPFKE